MKKISFLMCLLAALVLAATANPMDVAIIVHKDNALADVSSLEVEKIFKLETQHWKGNQRICLVLQEAGSPEKKIVLQKIYAMTDEELRKYWLGKIFRGEIAAFPQTESSGESVRRFVKAVPNAIGFVDAAKADDSVKVLRIDGKLPGEKGYALSDAADKP